MNNSPSVIASMLRIEQGTKQSHLLSASDELSNGLNRWDCFVPCSMRNMLAMTDEELLIAH